MKVHGQHDATEDAPIEFSRRHRIALLATSRLLVVLAVVLALTTLVWPRLFVVLLFGVCLALVVGVISSLSVIHAALILVDAPERRVRRNVVPTLIGIGSLVVLVCLVVYVVGGLLPQ
jgi:uncharacterized membrane protein